MQLYVDYQIACAEQDPLPTLAELELWVTAAINKGSTSEREQAELTVRIVNSDESQQLNGQYRDKDKPTNVLSFPFQNPPGITLPLLGDLIICKDVVEKEALQQNKPLSSHWAHMLIHGTLHLLGFDHIDEQEAEEMERIETELMQTLGFNDPYSEQE